MFEVGDVFDAAFLRSVDRLKLRARRVASAGSPADKRSGRAGSGMEFRDFRPYAAGDDIKSIDWNVYRRLGKLFLRQFEEERDLPVYLALDVSRSMFEGETPRALAGMRAAFAMAAVALQGGDSFGVLPFSGELSLAMRAGSGAGRLMRVARTLVQQRPQASTRFGVAMRKLAAIKQRRGLLVVVSDFFDPEGVEAVVKALGRVRHRLLLVQLVRASDAEPAPTAGGNFVLRDCESGEERDIAVTRTVLEAYRASYRAFQDGLDAFVRRRQAGLVRIDVAGDVVQQLQAAFPQGVLQL